MTTPTEELRIRAGIELEDSFESGSKYAVGDNELQAFREAVEAESDSERMKQPAVAEVCADGRHGLPKLFWIGDERAPVGAKLYHQPFPSTEQLQNQLEAVRYIVNNFDHTWPEKAIRELREVLANTQGDSNEQ